MTEPPLPPPAPCDHHKLARIAGLLYLVIILCGVWSEAVARAGLITPGAADATLTDLQAGLARLRLSLAADTVMALADVTLAVVFLHLLAPVGPVLARVYAVSSP